MIYYLCKKVCEEKAAHLNVQPFLYFFSRFYGVLRDSATVMLFVVNLFLSALQARESRFPKPLRVA